MKKFVTMSLEASPGSEESLADAVLAAIAATRSWDGCELVEVGRDGENAERLVVAEVWTSTEELQSYRAWRATPEGAMGLAGLVAGPPVVRTLDLVGGADGEAAAQKAGGAA